MINSNVNYLDFRFIGPRMTPYAKLSNPHCNLCSLFTSLAKTLKLVTNCLKSSSLLPSSFNTSMMREASGFKLSSGIWNSSSGVMVAELSLSISRKRR